ncbi:DUF4184 family protein [Actinoplanes sp. NBRC 103695]|uniref:DUF4184 family protein n=1 Tax=Actinoplanes sp. NBRC 103695 TaxID=3032202 RepID=UPI0025545391|nr:DUF4184 family protein [Actinoplanes sp. NBRC 103695]
MPLTIPTHPVGVVPLKMWRPAWFDGVALVVGAVAPDLSYAMHGVVSLHTHNLVALVWWGVPVTVVLTLPVRWAAPVIAAHLPGVGDFGVLGTVRHRWYVTVGSALIGAFSHLAWDWITHPGYVPSLSHEVLPGMPWWGLLSDASNLAGFVAGTIMVLLLGRAGLLREWHGPPPAVVPRPAVFWSVVAGTGACGVAAVLLNPIDWFAGQAVRLMLIAGLALLFGAAATRTKELVSN